MPQQQIKLVMGDTLTPTQIEQVEELFPNIGRVIGKSPRPWRTQEHYLREHAYWVFADGRVAMGVNSEQCQVPPTFDATNMAKIVANAIPYMTRPDMIEHIKATRGHPFDPTGLHPRGDDLQQIARRSVGRGRVGKTHKEVVAVRNTGEEDERVYFAMQHSLHDSLFWSDDQNAWVPINAGATSWIDGDVPIIHTQRQSFRWFQLGDMPYSDDDYRTALYECGLYLTALGLPAQSGEPKVLIFCQVAAGAATMGKDIETIRFELTLLPGIALNIPGIALNMNETLVLAATAYRWVRED